MKPPELSFSSEAVDLALVGSFPEVWQVQATCSLSGFQDWGWWKETVTPGDMQVKEDWSGAQLAAGTLGGARAAWSLNAPGFASRPDILGTRCFVPLPIGWDRTKSSGHRRSR